MKRPFPDIEELKKGVLSADRPMLSRAITLIESTLPADRDKGFELMEALAPHTGQSLRIGITGPPGVGKSTFIDAFGVYLASLGKKSAILTIDPSSPTTGGSILGDKTRMEKLIQTKSAYIRPSPAKKDTGAIGAHTAQVICLCEAAGFDVIIVETVGAGQSDVEVRSIVDFFLLLLMPGGGDELQGIKRGVMELADAFVITKKDIMAPELINKSVAGLQAVSGLIMPRHGWTPGVRAVSAVNNEGVDEVWKLMSAYQKQLQSTGEWNQMRQEQRSMQLDRMIKARILENFYADPPLKKQREELSHRVALGEFTVEKAVRELFRSV
ncbi:MAG: methylmalonyl Co-A mutase-associated GTPase MeaB [Cyclobacteriaceae bacterium]|nr:methylmalonyl Co-A mutase-associated GTPase MeaB [Cyclobacteriaceae bacterium]